MDSRETRPDFADALRYHGGNINVARRLFPEAPEPWIDLSTGINPVPYPVPNFPTASLFRLPEQSALVGLEATAAEAYRATTDVIAVPGTQAIIQWLPRIIPARRIAILGPTYGEHEKCWRGVGAEIHRASTLAELTACDVGVVVNPNNPDGRLLPEAALHAAAAAMAVRGGTLIVDEAFMDVVQPSESLAPALPANAIVLRSAGKAYGLAGLRLGFAIAGGDLALQIRTALGPWAVSGPAIAIGRSALADRAWLAVAIDRLVAESGRLDQLLKNVGFAIVGGTPLFRLARCPNSGLSFGRLARNGILVRPFAHDPGLLRFGIPHAQSDWERLETALDPSSTILQG